VNRPFQFRECGQDFISAHDETFSVAMHVYEVRPRKDKLGVDVISCAAVQSAVVWRPKRQSGGHPTRGDRPKPSQAHGSLCPLDFRPSYATTPLITNTGTVHFLSRRASPNFHVGPRLTMTPSSPQTRVSPFAIPWTQSAFHRREQWNAFRHDARPNRQATNLLVSQKQQPRYFFSCSAQGTLGNFAFSFL